MSRPTHARDRGGVGSGAGIAALEQRLADAPVAPSPLHSAQERANIRLEVLRLAHRPDVPVEQVIERAGCLAAFVLGEQPADKP